MSEIKGYVVRGKDRQLKNADVWAMADGVSMVRERAKLYGDVDAAIGAWAELRRCSWCFDVRILAVAEDGTETPLPTYAAALDEVGQLCAEVNLARGRTMAALAEAERLRGEVEAIRGQRDAFRDHLDLAYRNAYTERAAWARLVEAEQVHHAQTVLLGERDDDAKGAFAEVCAARQALRDLGVDVGSWLGEGPAS